MARVTKHDRLRPDLFVHLHAPVLHGAADELARPLTGGRIAMNLVTSTRRSDAANFGFDELMEHGARYERMEEFVDVCRKLWDATEADAMLWDRDSGRVGDPAKVHTRQPSRALLPRGGPTEHAALAAGPAGADPGRRVGARHQGVGLCRRPRVRRRHGAASAGEAARAAGRGAGRRSAAIRPASASSGRRRSWCARPRPRRTGCATCC